MLNFKIIFRRGTDAEKVLIIGIFLAVFGAAWGALYLMRGIEEPALEPAAAITEERQVSDSVHSYAAEDLAAGCRAEDKIFCAIEQVIKCTMAPELEGCDKEYVPGFVLGKAEETPRRGISRLRLPNQADSRQFGHFGLYEIRL